MKHLLAQFQLIFSGFQHNWFWTLEICLLLALIQIVNKLSGYRLNVLGLVPRRASGLLGVAFAPLLHADFQHLFFNIIPLYILLNLTLVFGLDKFYWITLTIVLGGNGLLWLLGRPARHIGASGVVFGYWGFLLANAYQHFSALTLILAIIVVYYFGSFAAGLLPLDKTSSWEGHLFGALAGVAAALYVV